MIEAGICSLLSTTSTITAIAGPRIYPDEVPKQPIYPALEYRIITATPSPTLDTSGFQRWRMEFTCKAKTAAAAAGLVAAVRKLLEGYKGVLADGTWLQDAQFIQLRSTYDRDALVYERTVEFYLFFDLTS